MPCRDAVVVNREGTCRRVVVIRVCKYTATLCAVQPPQEGIVIRDSMQDLDNETHLTDSQCSGFEASPCGQYTPILMGVSSLESDNDSGIRYWWYLGKRLASLASYASL